MSKLDAGGRQVLATEWDAIQGIPELVEMLAEIPDPNFDAWVTWDDSIDELVMLERLAANVPYDNSSSGLTADNVQDAINELVLAGAVPYAGYVRGSLGASVSATFNPVAAAWSVSQTTNPGLFRVTHNLNLASVRDLAVVPVLVLSGGGTDDRYCNVTNLNVNYFEVSCIDTGSGAVNDDFSFTAIRLVPP